MQTHDVTDWMNPVLGKCRIRAWDRHRHQNTPTARDLPKGRKCRTLRRTFIGQIGLFDGTPQFYPNDEGSMMVAADVGENGVLTLNKDFYIDFPKACDHIKSGLIRGRSTDSFCYPSVQ
jgi:selenium-binding protein 1